jgi:hypothetical protein
VKHTTQLLLVSGQRLLLVSGQRLLLVSGQRSAASGQKNPAVKTRDQSPRIPRFLASTI